MAETSTEERVARLEENYKNLDRKIDTNHENIDKKLDDILNNHLQSIYKRLDRLPIWATFLISVLASLSTGIIVRTICRGG